MEKLYIESGTSTPEINFDPENHTLAISGESYPENTASFYEPVFEWLNNYFNSSSQQKIILTIELLYFNSSSSKVLSDIFELLLSNKKNNESIVVNWRYHEENDMSLEYGEEFQEDYEDLEFYLIPFSDD